MTNLLRLLVLILVVAHGTCFSQTRLPQDKQDKLDRDLRELIKKEYGNPHYDTKKLKGLLSKGANPNATDENGETALHMAASHRLPAAIDVLLEKGAKLDAANKEGLTPLMRMGEPFSFGFGTPPYLIQSARMVYNQFLDLLRKGREKSLGLSVQNSFGNTLLHQLLADRMNEAAPLAVEAGSPLHLVNEQGNTPALIAAQERSEEQVALLKMMAQKGADFKIKNKEGKTVLSLVPLERAGEVFRILTEIQGKEEAALAMLADPVILLEEGHLSMLINDPSLACPLLEKEAQSIAAWKQKVDAIDSTKSIQCVCGQEKCSISLTEIAPPFMVKMMGKNSFCDGPNCFNTSLVGNKNLKDIRHVGADEILSFINSPLCREKSPEEGRKPGDIIIIHHKAVSFGDLVSDGPVHGFAYISEKFSFSKDSFSKDDGYLYTSTQDVFKKFRVLPRMQNMSTKTMADFEGRPLDIPVRELNGYRYAITYDCKSEMFPPIQDEALKAIDSRLEKSLCEVGETVFHREPAAEEVEHWSSEVKGVLALLEDGIQKKNPEALLIKARATSLEDQVTILKGEGRHPF